MRRIVLSLLVGLALVSTVEAQYPVIRVHPTNMGPDYVPEVPPGEDVPYVGPAWTVNAEYLLWFLQPIHFRTPLVGTTTDPNVNLGGVVTTLGVDEDGFVNFFGPGDRNRGPMHGVRLSATLALAMSQNRCVYTEVAGMWLPRQANRRTLASNPGGNPPVLLPFQTTTSDPLLGPAGEYSAVVAGNIAGNPIEGEASVLTATGLWGGEWNLAGPVYESANLGMEMIFGFRYLGTNDLVEISARSSIAGGASTFDRFTTANHFYGGQAGFRVIAACERWAGVCTTKLGLGATSANLDVRGSAVLPEGFPGTRLPGGFYTDRTNIGEHSTDDFGVVVDLNLGVRYAVTPGIGVSVGYNFLYWSGVVRAGDQITRTLNPANGAVLNAVSGQAPTPLAPESQVIGDLGGIWAHGVNFGLDFRF